MKYKLHYPVEQFGFIETEVEGEHADAVAEYRSLRREALGGEGLPDKEFRPVLDKYLTHGTMESSDYERMNAQQKEFIQVIKRSFNRIKSRDSELEDKYQK